MREVRSRLKLWIVLPAFNEAAGLPKLLDRVDEAMADARLEYEVIVVDDGSSDPTADVALQWAEKMPLRLLTHPTNEGLGASIRDGLLAACRAARPRDVIITLDADNTHTPELIVRMIRMVREGHDVVIASRYRPGSRVRGVPASRAALSLGASLLLRVLFPTRGVRDYTSGYRAYRAGLLQSVVDRRGNRFFQQGGFQVMVDILLQLRHDREIIFGEVPIILRYDLKEGASKMDVGRTVKDTLRLIARRRMGA